MRVVHHAHRRRLCVVEPWGRSMTAITERDELVLRARRSREILARTDDPNSREIHRALLDLYARRAGEACSPAAPGSTGRSSSLSL